MSSDADRRRVQAYQYRLSQETPGTSSYESALHSLENAKSHLAHSLFNDGLNEKSKAKIDEAFTLMKAWIQYLGTHLTDDPSNPMLFRVEMENLGEWSLRLSKEGWYRR